MKRVLMGHRGVGKSTLLARHQTYFPEIPHFDLDLEIEKKLEQPLSVIFQDKGEKKFREIEIEIFERLIKKEHFVISVGGGFEIQKISYGIDCVYVSRITDKKGRIFLNRPRLAEELSPLEESLMIFKQREEKFLKRADWIYSMAEGLSCPTIAEEKIFKQNRFDIDDYVTLDPKHTEILKNFSHIELRTDLFTKKQVKEFLIESSNHFLVSIRTLEEFQFLADYKINEKIRIDWSLELGLPSETEFAHINILSSHEFSIEESIEQFNQVEIQANKKFELKLCPVVRNWQDLEIGHRWQKKDQDRRSFLPRTDFGIFDSSRWRWYRQLQRHSQPLNFISGFSLNLDQPSLFEVIDFFRNKPITAVLGDPVEHSRTPSFHKLDFASTSVAVPVSEGQLSVALNFLKDIGIHHFAITSPLKLEAEQLSQVQGCNSLFIKKSVLGKNTDIVAFEKICSKYLKPNDIVAVWGGGGILGLIEKKYPEYYYFSARTGQEKKMRSVSPTVVIWAAPRKPRISKPPIGWLPRLIIDMNYTDTSLGLEYATEMKSAKYVSGLELFEAQAAEQIKFFTEISST